MSVASGNVQAIRPGEDGFARLLRELQGIGAYVFSIPRLGEELIAFESSGHAWNLGRIVSCKFFDDSGRSFVVQTHRMFRELSLGVEVEETVLVYLADGLASFRTTPDGHGR